MYHYIVVGAGTISHSEALCLEVSLVVAPFILCELERYAPSFLCELKGMLRPRLESLIHGVAINRSRCAALLFAFENDFLNCLLVTMSFYFIS